jgi:ferredoxin-NADP reductase
MVAQDVMEVVCDLEGSQFTFKAGQYVSVTLPDLAYPDPKGKSRNFNLANSPNNFGYLYFAFIARQSGFKRTLAELSVGARVGIRGPYGMFVLPEGEGDLVMVADGIGVTPCLSIAIYAAEMRLERRITMLYTGGGRKTLPYVDELQQLVDINRNFEVKFAGTPAAAMDSSFIKKSVGHTPTSLHWLVAGAPEQTARVRSTLLKMGVQAQLIRTEDFTGY